MSSTALFLAPHNDDECLFGAFTILREKPEVVVVTRSILQEQRGRGITFAMREAETTAALEILGVDGYAQWTYPDSDPDWRSIEHRLALFDPRRVFAPTPYEEGGHPHHDRLGELAVHVFGRENVTLYHSYVNGRGRVRSADAVPVEDPDWIRRKLCALAQYESQIREPSTGHHFAEALHEWYA